MTKRFCHVCDLEYSRTKCLFGFFIVLYIHRTLTSVKAALVGSIFRLLTALTVARAMEADMLKLLEYFVFGCKHLEVMQGTPASADGQDWLVT